MTLNYQQLSKVMPSLHVVVPNIADLMDCCTLTLGGWHYVVDLPNAVFSFGIMPDRTNLPLLEREDNRLSKCCLRANCVAQLCLMVWWLIT